MIYSRFKEVKNDLINYVYNNQLEFISSKTIGLRYLWFTDLQGYFDDSIVHFEVIIEKDIISVDVHFENKQYNQELFELLKPTLPAHISEKKWQGKAISHNKKFDLTSDIEIVEIIKCLNELYEFTYPILIDRLKEIFQQSKDDIDMEDKIKILEYKNQIILQGPPGTGKTRLAKEIAFRMMGTNGDVNLNTYLKKGLSIPNASGAENYYLLEKVTNNSVELSSERATKKWSASFNKIQEKISQLQRGETPKNTGGDDPYVLAVAKYIFINITNTSNVLENNEQFKLIQFHPSYTYEDFVRGIVAESKGEKIEYKNVNKTLGLFAEEALKNYLDSKKDLSELSLEKWIDEQFNLFVDSVSETLEKDKIPLTENVDLVDLMDDAFLYIGENWKGYEHRMTFKDIKQAYLDNNLIRQDIVQNLNLTGSARQHATYYIVVLKMFMKFLEGKIIPTTQVEIKEKPFILIIDEINRANLSSVLGELIYALEYRGEDVESMYSVDDSLLKNKLTLPPNLYIIGTMNTADRSVGHIDYAIRRRFAFVDVLPKDLTDEMKEGAFYTNLFTEVKSLFATDHYKTKSEYISQEFDPKDVALGHSYFIDKTEKGGTKKVRWKYEIKPILTEYIRDGVLKQNALKKIEEIEIAENLEESFL